MPKLTGHDCFQCSKLSTEEAKTKNCWGQKCYKRRNYHQNKDEINLRKKQQRNLGKNNDYKEISVDYPTAYAANIIFYRQRQNSPVHAIEANVSLDSKKVLRIKPIHCAGLSGTQVVAIMTNILAAASEELQVQIPKFVSRTERNPSRCPICNLHDDE